MVIHPERPYPGRRRNAVLFSFSAMLMFTSMLSSAMAYDMEVDNRAYDSQQFKKLGRLGQIHIDQRPPPALPGMLERREEASSSTTSSEPETAASTTSSSLSMSTESSPSSTSGTSVASEAASTTTATGSSPSVITTPIPRPFDTSLGSNFTAQSCPDFFSSFLNNSTFTSCTPVSLLLQNSNSFFQAERDATLLSETLDYACNAPLAICSPLMTSLASQLIDTANCGADYTNQNPLVLQAYNGLLAYEPLYRATCLKNPKTGSYCFSDAIANTSNQADAFPYYTALGLNMPINSKPTCNQCLQETMNVFAGYAGESSQPLAVTYTPTAFQIDLGCGTTFVNTTVAVAKTGDASSGQRGWSILLAAGLVSAALLS